MLDQDQRIFDPELVSIVVPAEQWFVDLNKCRLVRIHQGWIS